MTASEMEFFNLAAVEHPGWRWYALADSAQSRQLPAVLLAQGGEVRCLFGANQGTPLAEHAPHLVSLPPPSASSTAWQWILRHARRSPSVTVIASAHEFDTVFRYLQAWTEVRLPDGNTMFFAFWDPAILGTLVGQSDDLTLYLRGPVLKNEQRAALLARIEGWWYWDRDSQLHQITPVSPATEDVVLPVQLNQAQVDDLVEASVPDHVLYYLSLNQPLLLDDVPASQRYGLISAAIGDARGLGIEGMQDLVNYVCAVLIYKDQMKQDAEITALLRQVKEGALSFSRALEEFP